MTATNFRAVAAFAASQFSEANQPKSMKRGPTPSNASPITLPTLALAAHHQALTLAPDNPAVLCNLAMFLAGNGDSGQAEALLRKAAGEPGATAQIRQDLALVLGLQGKLAEAEQLERQDLPPDVADNNIAYLTAAASAPHGAGVQPTATPTSTSQTEPKDRSWSAVAKAQAQDGTPID